jgi:hypothetical protein
LRVFALFFRFISIISFQKIGGTPESGNWSGKKVVGFYLKMKEKKDLEARCRIFPGKKSEFSGDVLYQQMLNGVRSPYLNTRLSSPGSMPLSFSISFS